MKRPPVTLHAAEEVVVVVHHREGHRTEISIATDAAGIATVAISPSPGHPYRLIERGRTQQRTEK